MCYCVCENVERIEQVTTYSHLLLCGALVEERETEGGGEREVEEIRGRRGGGG